ncbi:MAG: hypothetical protein AUJ55_04760 [Proteobacteria bacterium CG1_02_64_396]|nr:MAG: hypothetical protein AUJ55_04760 [Proteobacteria bacterium CG1_02_64_396]
MHLTLGEAPTALIGPNGAGKTTLARLLTGELRPSQGSITASGRVVFLPQHRRPEPCGSVAEALGIDPQWRAFTRILAGEGGQDDLLTVGECWDLEDQARAALERMGLADLALDRPAATLSGGEQTRVALAGCLLQNPELLILDEPTNHLDRAARQAVYRLVETQPGLLIISHDRELLRRVAHIVELSPLGVRHYGGNLDLYERERQLQAEAARQRLDHAEQEWDRLRREAQQAQERKARRDGRGKRQRAQGGQAKVLLDVMKERSERSKGRLAQRIVRQSQGVEAQCREAQAQVAREAPPGFELPTVTLPADKGVLALDAAAYRPPNAARLVVPPQTWQMNGPARIAITGPNGSGKTTLLKLLAGRLNPTEGVIRRGTAQVAYLAQEPEFAQGGTVLEVVGWARPDLAEGVRRELLAPFLFRGDEVDQKVTGLSGGERLRLALCLAWSSPHPPELLLLDEPTNHLDLEAQAQLEGALRRYAGALVVVSHDEGFLQRIGIKGRIELGSL